MCEIYYKQQYYLNQTETVSSRSNNGVLVAILPVQVDYSRTENLYQKNDPISGQQLPVNILEYEEYFYLEWGYYRPWTEIATVDDVYEFVKQDCPK